MSNDYYNTLGVSPSASVNEIKDRFRFLSQAYHPDKFGAEKHKKDAEEEFKRINSAYQVLSDPAERARYDASRAQSFRRPGFSEQNFRQSSRRQENERRPTSKPEPPPKSSRDDGLEGEQGLDIWAGVGGLFGLFIIYVIMYFVRILSK